MKVIKGKDLKETMVHGGIIRKKLLSSVDVKSKLQTVNDAVLLPNKSFINDYHADCEEIYYFLEGTGEMKIDKKIFKVNTDDCIVIEPKETHSLKNISSINLRWISIRIMI